MVITNQKPIINAEITKRKELKHNTKKAIKPEGKRAREERNREELLKHLEKRQQSSNKYILINSYFKCQ